MSMTSAAGTKMITKDLREPVLCAVSGGIDSMYLLCRLRGEGWQVAAAHFNHGLRGPEADRDEAFVENFCRDKGIPFYAGRGDVRLLAEKEGLSEEDAARRLRYAFLQETAEKIGAGCIATAHNAEDNAETLLLRLSRGTGLRGLGGIPPRRGNIVRPMLDERRKEAEWWLEERGIPHVEDSSNASEDYARNRLRHGVIPVMTGVNSAFIENAGRTARLLREDEEFFQSLAREHIAHKGADAVALAALPKPLAVRVLMLLFGYELSEKHLEALLLVARTGGETHIPGHRVANVGGQLRLDPVPPEPLRERELFPGDTVVPEAELLVRRTDGAEPGDLPASSNIFYFSVPRICGRISLSARRPGDRMAPQGRGCTKTLKQLFEEMGVPAGQRASWPLLRDEAGVIAVYGLGAAERAAARPGDGPIIRVEFCPRERKEEKQ